MGIHEDGRMQAFPDHPDQEINQLQAEHMRTFLRILRNLSLVLRDLGYPGESTALAAVSLDIQARISRSI